MSLNNRLRSVERRLGRRLADAEIRRFVTDGIWPRHAATRNLIRQSYAYQDMMRLAGPPGPWVMREVRRRHALRQSMIDRSMADDTPLDRDALPPLFPNEEESAALEAEVRQWEERYRTTGELPHNDELRRDVMATVRYEDDERQRRERLAGLR